MNDPTCKESLQVAEPRFFLDHGVVHDRRTGRHVADLSADETLALLRELENDRNAWRFTAKAVQVACPECGVRAVSPGSTHCPDGHSYAEAMASVSELMDALRDLLIAAERLDPTEGVCCCGDDMATHAHPMSCGHEPVDAGHYYHGAVIEQARAVIAKAEGA